MTSTTTTSTIHKQKAKMLVEMANAVEDSNMRRRHLLQEAYTVHNAHGVHQLLMEDLQQKEKDNHNNSNSNKKEADGASHASPTSVTATQYHYDQQEQQQQHHDEQASSNHNNNHNNASTRNYPQQQQRQRSSIVSLEQMRELYTAMIQSRAHADLRYQMLELRYLDLSASLLDLEDKYRRSETEKEALKKSCDAMSMAAAMSTSDASAGDYNRNNHWNANTNNNNKGPGNNNNNNNAALQQELQSLHGQRHKLVQTNLELRKQLKQMQIQMQHGGGSTSPSYCARCQPDASFDSPSTYASSSMHRPADFAMQEIVERFHNTTSSDDDNEQDDSDDEDDDDTNNDNEQRMQQQQHQRQDEYSMQHARRHQDNLSLLGMQYATPANKPKNIDWAPPPPHQLTMMMGSMRHIMTNPSTATSSGPATTRRADREIINRPKMYRTAPTATRNHHNNNRNSNAAKVVRQSAPTLTSILPGAGPAANSNTAPKRSNNSPKEIPLNQIMTTTTAKPVPKARAEEVQTETERPCKTLSDLAANEIQEIDLHPLDDPRAGKRYARPNHPQDGAGFLPVNRNLDERQFQEPPQKQNMEYEAHQQYGMIDEFGRSVSRRNVIKCQGPFRRGKSNSREVDLAPEPPTSNPTSRSQPPQQPLPQQSARRHHPYYPQQEQQQQQQRQQQQQSRHLESIPYEYHTEDHSRSRASQSRDIRLPVQQLPLVQENHRGYVYRASHDHRGQEQTLASLQPSELKQAVSQDSTGPPFSSRTRQQRDANVPSSSMQYAGRRQRMTLETTDSDVTKLMSNRKYHGAPTPNESRARQSNSGGTTLPHRTVSQPQRVNRPGEPDRNNTGSIRTRDNNIERDNSNSSNSMGSYFQRIKKTLQQEI